jgi:hypothetical protein
MRGKEPTPPSYENGSPISEIHTALPPVPTASSY